MAIEDRNLRAGELLVGRYGGEQHRLLVLKDNEGKLGFELDGGTIYRSLSAAGKAIVGGACNGWRFWSREEELNDAPDNEDSDVRCPETTKEGKACRGKPISEDGRCAAHRRAS